MSTAPRLLAPRILRHAAGYVELAEMLVDGESPVPPSACRLLHRALDTLDELPTEARGAAEASLLEGEALRALGDWERALVPLARVAEAKPRRLEAWLGLGWCLKRLGRLDEAIRMLQRGRDASPSQAIVLYNLACYHSLAGDVPAAIENLTQAIALDDRYRDLTGTERDFDPIRTDPRFQAATHVTV
jgi:tetratricopeptide (TPR) repeat protein